RTRRRAGGRRGKRRPDLRSTEPGHAGPRRPGERRVGRRRHRGLPCLVRRPRAHRRWRRRGRGRRRLPPPPPAGRRPGGRGRAGVATVASPAWYGDHGLTVGGVDADGAAADFSLRGPWVDVAAPAVGLRSVGADGDGVADLVVSADGARTPISGTSFAAPFVAGVAALVRQARPGLSARQVISRITGTTLPAAGGHDHAVGHGVVDPVAAVTGVRRSGRPDPASSVIAAPGPEPIAAGAGAGGVVAATALAVGAVVLVVVGLSRPPRPGARRH